MLAGFLIRGEPSIAQHQLLNSERDFVLGIFYKGRCLTYLPYRHRLYFLFLLSLVLLLYSFHPEEAAVLAHTMCCFI